MTQENKPEEPVSEKNNAEKETGALESIDAPVPDDSEVQTKESQKNNEQQDSLLADAGKKGETGSKPAPAAVDPIDHTQVLTGLSHVERSYLLSMAGLSTLVRSTGRLFWTNFLMGMARGIGFVIGMSIIGALVVGIWDEFLSVTGIGRFIARVLEEIHRNTPQ